MNVGDIGDESVGTGGDEGPPGRERGQRLLPLAHWKRVPDTTENMNLISTISRFQELDKKNNGFSFFFNSDHRP